MSFTGGAAYRDGQGRTRCRRCDKIVYSGEEEALGAADAAREQGVLLRAYREPACGYWHLTSRAELPLLANQEERARRRAGAGGLPPVQRFALALAVVVAVAVVVAMLVLQLLGGDEPAPVPAAASSPAVTEVVASPSATPTPAATPAPSPTRTVTPTSTVIATPTPQPTPEPVVARTIGNTDGTGVALRDDCDDDARFSARGEGWAETTQVELLEEGEGRCAGWVQVEANGVASWVREEYVIARVLSPLWTVGNTGGVGVALRDDCANDARFSAPGQGWRDDTEVTLIEAGREACAGWLLVAVDGVQSWVREVFLIEVVE